MTRSLFALHQVFPALREDLRHFQVTDRQGMTHLVYAQEAADAHNLVDGAVLVQDLTR